MHAWFEILPVGYLSRARQEFSWVLVGPIWVCWDCLDHPVAELGQQLEVRSLLVIEHLELFLLFLGLVEIFEEV